MASAGLAACGSDTSLLDSGASLNQQTAVGNLAPSVNTKPITRTIAYRAAIGPPDDVAAELARQLSDAAIDQGIALVVDPKYQADITLRGYVTAFRKGNTVNVTYLWDVVDARGQRVNRIAGEEALTAGVDVTQPWAAITPAVSRMIALKTVAELGRWAKTHPEPGVVSNGGIGAGGSAPPAGAGAAALAPGR